MESNSNDQDFLPLLGTDYVEFYVGNAKQAAHYYKTAFGYQDFAYSGPETGDKEKVSYVLMQDKVRLILTTPLHPTSVIAEHVNLHGDGVKAIALTVNDAYDAFEQTVKRGAKPYMQPKTMQDEDGEIKMSGIHIYGDTVHLFIERKNYKGVFMPGFRKHESNYQPTAVGLKYIDHCVGNVGWNQMNTWVSFYEEVMGFKNILTFDDKQHIAIATDNIVDTVTQLSSRGVEFLNIPSTYYDDLLDRIGPIDEDVAPLKQLGILVDRDDEGYLLQIFTKPVEDRPTLFFEIIQRKGAKSFGAGNFKALFEALEREQDLRGNL